MGLTTGEIIATLIFFLIIIVSVIAFVIILKKRKEIKPIRPIDVPILPIDVISGMMPLYTNVPLLPTDLPWLPMDLTPSQVPLFPVNIPLLPIELTINSNNDALALDFSMKKHTLIKIPHKVYKPEELAEVLTNLANFGAYYLKVGWDSEKHRFSFIAENISRGLEIIIGRWAFETPFLSGSTLNSTIGITYLDGYGVLQQYGDPIY